MKLRDYQQYAVDSIFQYFEDGGTGNPIVAMPTGTGKSLVIAGFIQQACKSYPSTKVMKLTHVKELIEQNYDKLLKIWPTAPAGVYSAGLKKKEAFYPISFGGIGSVARANLSIFGSIDLLLIDECHLLSPNDTTMYHKVINKLKTVNPFLKTIGFTATPYRLGQGMLTEEGGLFTDICCDMTKLEVFNWFIEEGYLVPLIPKQTTTEINLDNVHIRGGEYKQDELQQAVDQDILTKSAVLEIIANGQDRGHWLIFASGIKHAENVCQMLTYYGIDSSYIDSNMPDSERDARILMFKEGKIQALVNNGILTTGFDFPSIDLIAMLRPTQSASLWVQMLGRGTRPDYEDGYDLSTKEGRLQAIEHSSKKNCLVLDFAGNTKRLGPVNDPVLPKAKGKGSGEAPIKICEECGTYNHASVRHCVNCGHEFPKFLKIKSKAGTDALIATGETFPVEVFQVERVTYSIHHKEGKPDSIAVSYFCKGFRMFKEFICLEHQGWPSRHARAWWRGRDNNNYVPNTTAEAFELLGSLKTPTFIRVLLKDKYGEIKAYSFLENGFGENNG